MGFGYGKSKHYLEAEGQAYFSWQSLGRDAGGRIEARKFAPFVGREDYVVDFGCGGGYTLKHLICKRRVGIDINPAAQKAAIANGVECPADLLELPDGIADVVISNHALEHVPDPIQALREIRRILRCDGMLVLVVPIDDWRTQTRFEPSNVNNHLFTWTPQLIGNCLVEAGFDSGGLTIRILSHAWFPGATGAFAVLPEKIFDAACWLFSIFARRRQIIVLARDRPECSR